MNRPIRMLLAVSIVLALVGASVPTAAATTADPSVPCRPYINPTCMWNYADAGGGLADVPTAVGAVGPPVDAALESTDAGSTADDGDGDNFPLAF